EPKRVFLFQQRLAEEQIDFDHINRAGHQAIFVRRHPSTLQVQVGPVMPGAPVGQLLKVSAIDLADSAATTAVGWNVCCEAAETATELLREVWPEIRQVVSRDAAVRLLLDSGHDHAFQYLWAERFAQPEEHLAIFGRSIRGGGLRVVMGPAP